jgi:hypothetical protein
MASELRLRGCLLFQYVLAGLRTSVPQARGQSLASRTAPRLRVSQLHHYGQLTSRVRAHPDHG